MSVKLPAPLARRPVDAFEVGGLILNVKLLADNGKGTDTLNLDVLGLLSPDALAEIVALAGAAVTDRVTSVETAPKP